MFLIKQVRCQITLKQKTCQQNFDKLSDLLSKSSSNKHLFQYDRNDIALMILLGLTIKFKVDQEFHILPQTPNGKGTHTMASRSELSPHNNQYRYSSPVFGPIL